MTYHQFKGDAAEVKLGQRALVARLHRAVVDEHDAALLQRAHRHRHVRCAQAEPHQTFVPLDVVGAWRRLDQLEIELVAGTLEQRALRQHAEILAARQHREAEQMPVEVHPVARALAQDGLDHAEVMQARERWRASGTKPMRCSRSPKACGWLVAYSMNSIPSIPSGLDGSGMRSRLVIRTVSSC